MWSMRINFATASTRSIICALGTPWLPNP